MTSGAESEFVAVTSRMADLNMRDGATLFKLIFNFLLLKSEVGFVLTEFSQRPHDTSDQQLTQQTLEATLGSAPRPSIRHCSRGAR